MKTLRNIQSSNSTDDSRFTLLGAAQDITVTGDGTGTKLEAIGFNNFILGWQGALLEAAGISPNGLPEQRGQSQIVDAIKKLTTVYEDSL